MFPARHLFGAFVVSFSLAFAGRPLACAQEDDPPPGAATTVQLPTFGVAIDAEGVLSLKTFPDPGGRLRAERIAAAKKSLPPDLSKAARLRKVSLRRLEAAVAERLRAGMPLEEVERHLAGLTRVQFVFAFEAEGDEPGDIVLAGPAEPWIFDPSARPVGMTSGRPVLLLEDLAVALRAFAPPPAGKRPDRPFLGCTIDPTPDGLASLMKYQRTIPRAIPVAGRDAAAVEIAQGVRDSLGMATIRVFGISPRTHFAQILVEADYRMKRIAIGIEPPPVKMATFLSALDSPREATLQRWWFTPEYDGIRIADDALAMEMVGQGVKLQAEDIRIGPDGALAAAGEKPSKASQLFCSAFTKKYPDIAAASPVYAQLRNMMDLAIVAAFLRRHDMYARSGWTADVLRDEGRLPCEALPVPKQVACVVNWQWKGARLLTPAGGGVSIDAEAALEPGRLLADENGRLEDQRKQLPRGGDDRWWWD
ncbi:MAG TPA: DUF1598 domain-containing protein [Pirellulaceae bacterium]|nr:DUF1598 domain-containing protein [Pirellulaceae bacterium]